MSTRDEIITKVLRRCGNRVGDTVLTAAAEEEILTAQNNLEQEPELPWFCLSAPAQLTCTADQQHIDLPSDFLMPSEIHDWYLTPVTGGDTDEFKLHKNDYNILRAKYLNEAAGIPKRFALDADDRIYLFPTPSAEHTIAFRYMQAEAQLSSGSVTNGWSTKAEDWLIGELGRIIAQDHLRDDAMAQQFLGLIARGQKRVMDKTVMLRELGMDSGAGDS